jgi:hypothetical protein
MNRDVILTVYSTSSLAPANQWAKDFFKEEPIILNMPGTGGASFRAKAIQWAKTGDLFAAALKELNPKLSKEVNIRRRGLVTFSVGWSAADEILKFEKELSKLDAYLLVDGCHTPVLNNWINLGTKAAKWESLMIMAHSSIKPPFISATETNNKIFSESKNIRNNSIGIKEDLQIPDYILNTKMDSPLKITAPAAGNLPAITKTWTQFPLKSAESCGGLVKLHYDGNDRPDHMFVCWHVQKQMYKLLSEFWV